MRVRFRPVGGRYNKPAPQNANDRNGIAVSNVTYLINRRRRMENFFLFILSSSSCTLVTSVVLLLRPITAMP